MRYELKTYTPSGKLYRHIFYRTLEGLKRSKERQNLEYGAHLKAEAFDTLTGQKLLILR